MPLGGAKDFFEGSGVSLHAQLPVNFNLAHARLRILLPPPQSAYVNRLYFTPIGTHVFRLVRPIGGVLRGQGFEWQENRVSSNRSSHSQGLRTPCMLTYSLRSLFSHTSLPQLDSAAQFNQASRPDLAGKEQQEADLLARFLPPLLPETEIDGILQKIIAEQASQGQSSPHKSIGKLFKAFYSRVDRSAVDPDLVKRRAEALLLN